MKRTTCYYCRYWRPGETQNMAGECRRSPPVVIAFGDTIETHFPEANSDDWCGAWTQRDSCTGHYSSAADGGMMVRCQRDHGHKGDCGPLDVVKDES